MAGEVVSIKISIETRPAEGGMQLETHVRKLVSANITAPSLHSVMDGMAKDTIDAFDALRTKGVL